MNPLAPNPPPLFDVRLRSIVWTSLDVSLFEFASIRGGALPAASAGSHIDVVIPNGEIRQYSVLRTGSLGDSFWIAVKREPESRGGSAWLHEQARVGQMFQISAPRNLFPLDETAAHSLLVAGGIGITPILAMAEQLDRLGLSWEMHYSCRSRDHAPLLDALAPFGDRVRLRFDDEHPGTFLDLEGLIAAAPPASHFYCCGPKPMLAAYEAAASHLPQDRVHLEYFSAKQEAAIDGGFIVELSRSGKELFVPPGKTILEVVGEAGVRVSHSCQEGVCGSCETGVISGRPDHRDSVLSTGERERGDVMMICCSGSLGERLVLDL